MYYVRAESEEGNDYDLIVLAHDPQHAIEIWHYDWNGDDPEPFWTWEDIGIGVGIVIAAEDLIQNNLTPGSANWNVTPVTHSVDIAKAS